MPSLRAKEVFLEALSHPAGERTAIVLKACEGDASLRAQVEDLLHLHNAAGPFMSCRTGMGDAQSSVPSSSGSAIFSMTAPLAEKPGTIIGRYKLLQQIGEGGFGVVYMAEQEQPVRRKVALKVIKLGMDTRQVIARFEAERQALAMMDHPNIARVLDAGATETGRPYFVMELVKGVPITRYCDQERICLADRLGLFMNVCSAVQHAHQKGIIHRDLKPSNILVTLHDGKPVPKVIDFGIAKATEHNLTERTMFTEYGQFLGTPAYMSPEQAELSGLDVDTRSDIYSLGVLLYELLTSSLPFDPQRLLSAGRAEMARIIKEEEPHRPSTRLRTLAPGPICGAGDPLSVGPSAMSSPSSREELDSRATPLSAIARMRHTDPQSLMRTLRGDLDWIVMKCLEKDRTRRYETANGLARDVARFLAGETVAAAPPSTRYRLRKFVRRNRTVVMTAGTVAAAMVLGLAVATAGFVQARRQRNAAQLAYAAEQEQRRIALMERDKGRVYAEDLRHELYASKIEKIQRILAADGVEPVKPLLADCDPELRGWEWERLRFLADGSEATMQAIEGPISAVQFSAKGSWFITAGGHGLTRVWDSQTLHMRFETRDPRQVAGLVSAAVSADESVMATTDGATINLWDARNGRPIRSVALPRTDGTKVALDATGSRLAVGYRDGNTQLYDVDTGELSFELAETAARGCGMAFSRDGSRILVGSLNNEISISDAADGTLLWAKRGAGFVVINVAFSPDEQLVASIGQDARIWLRQADTGELVYRVASGKGAARALAFHPGGHVIAVGGADGLISFFRTSTGEKLYSLHGHEAEIIAMDFHPMGRYLISGAKDGILKRWHLGTSGSQAALRHTHAFMSVAFATGDERLWAIAGDGKLLSIRVPECTKDLADTPAGYAACAAVSPGGERFVFARHQPNGMSPVVLTDENLTVLQRWEVPDQTVLLFGPRRLLLGASSLGPLRVWDTTTGEVLWKHGLREHAWRPNPVVFSRDELFIIHATAEGVIQVRDARTGALVREFPSGQPKVVRLAVDFGGDRLFCGGHGAIEVWDWSRGERLMTIAGHSGYLTALAPMPGDTRLVSGGEDGTIRLWDLASGRQVMLVGRHDGAVFGLAVSADGGTIATGGGDHSLRLWETHEPTRSGLDARYESARELWVPYRDSD